MFHHNSQYYHMLSGIMQLLLSSGLKKIVLSGLCFNFATFGLMHQEIILVCGILLSATLRFLGQRRSMFVYSDFCGANLSVCYVWHQFFNHVLIVVKSKLGIVSSAPNLAGIIVKSRGAIRFAGTSMISLSK